MSNGRRRTYSPEISADIEAKLAALTAELDALAAWACDQYDDGDEQFGRRAGVARGRELLAERDALKAKLKIADAHAEECRKATLETLATASARECQAAQREQQLRAALRETREALAYIERSGPGMSWNDVDHYWACSGCGERIVHPWREERHVDHRPECRFAVLASHADLAEGGKRG